MGQLANILVLLALLSGATPSLAGDNPMPVQENVETYGGISKEEREMLDKQTNRDLGNVMKRFTEGRNDSDNGGNGISRFSTILEMHDANYDGISDHDTSGNTASLLEKAAEEGLGIKGGAEKRSEEFARLKKEFCDKEYKAGKKDCQYISPNIINAGSAHDGEEGPHRKWHLRDSVQESARKVGRKLGEKAIDDAKIYQGGKRDVGPNIDKLKSEAAAAEEFIDKNLLNGMRTLRASRLANGNQNVGGDPSIGGLIQSGASDEQVARAIAEKSAVGDKPFCNVGGQWKDCGSLTEADKRTAEKTGAEIKRKTLWDLQANRNSGGQDNLSDEEFLKLQNEARKNLTDKDRQAVQERAGKLVGCLKVDGFCDASTLKKVTGDPGEYYRDTREMTYENAYKARQGPLNDFVKTMSANKDFSRETNPQEWDAMMKSVERAKKAAQDFKRADTGNYYQNDPSRQSARDIFKRRPGGPGNTMMRAEDFAGQAPKNAQQYYRQPSGRTEEGIGKGGPSAYRDQSTGGAPSTPTNQNAIGRPQQQNLAPRR